MIKTIDGAAFSRMMLSAAAEIDLNKQKVNELNVFPVPGGWPQNPPALPEHSSLRIPGPGGIALRRRADCGGMSFGADVLAQSAVDAAVRVRYGVTESFGILLHADALLRADRRAGFASAAGAFVAYFGVSCGFGYFKRKLLCI